MPHRNRERSRFLRTCAASDTRGAGRRTGAALLAGLLLVAGPALADDPPAPADRSGKSLSAEGPIAPGAGEAAYWAKLDKLLTPLTGLKVDQADLDRVKRASGAIAKGDVVTALALATETGNKSVRTIIEWLRLRAGYGSAAEIQSFLDANPDWPERVSLTARLEEQLLDSETGAAAARARFANRAPETGAGLGALAAAHLAAGDRDKAKALVAEAWRKHDMSAAVEARFLARFKALLGEADHRWRLDRVLMADQRWTAARNAQAAIAKRIVPLLSAAEQKKANARIAVYLRAKSAAKEMAALPAESTPDWGLVFQRIQLLRRSDKIEEAAKLLLAAPTDPGKIVSPDDWWDERRALAYELLQAGKPKLAYELVREAGPLSENPIKDQRFMAGWLAMRHLGDVKRAEVHFRDLRKLADGPLSRAKGDYWVGRALEAKGAKAEATEAYRAAARERDTFHGQLARQKLEPGRVRLDVKPPAEPSAAEVERFVTIAPAQAAIVAHRAGLGGSITRPLLVNLRTRGKTESWSALTAHLAKRLGDNQMSLRLAKSAIADGHDLLIYAYPVHAFPSYTPLTPPPETAVLLGIARQETEFNATIVSGAGARGILQVMPVTARHVCRDYKLKCDIPRLLTDTSYNTMMASAYIGDRMREFGGNYVLTLAGYNAGPGRARQWMREFGDPRDPKVDAVDWIERIPFEETRGYVAKVLANIQVYRARLGLDAPLRLEEDLGLNKRHAGNADQRSGSRRAASGE